MEIFIAGATGVLGRRVVKLFVDRGHSVTGLARSVQNETFLRNHNARIARTDILDREAITEHVKRHDAVLHLATKIPTGAKPTRDDWKMNDMLRTAGAENLIHASLQAGVRVYVQESIAHLYNRRDGADVDETSPLGTDLPFMLESALTMEKIIEKNVRENHLPAITLRFGGFYAADAHNSKSMIEGVKRKKMPVIGKGEYYWNLIHADDAAEAVVAAVENHNGNTGRAYNVCDDQPVTMKDLLYAIAEMTNSPEPASLPVLLARIVLGNDTLHFLQVSQRVSNRLAKSALVWKPAYPSFREGLRQVLGRMGR
jgi:nucleoside-diphosphate-sugar epimerase